MKKLLCLLLCLLLVLPALGETVFPVGLWQEESYTDGSSVITFKEAEKLLSFEEDGTYTLTDTTTKQVVTEKGMWEMDADGIVILSEQDALIQQEEGKLAYYTDDGISLWSRYEVP